MTETPTQRAIRESEERGAKYRGTSDSMPKHRDIVAFQEAACWEAPAFRRALKVAYEKLERIGDGKKMAVYGGKGDGYWSDELWRRIDEARYAVAEIDSILSGGERS